MKNKREKFIFLVIGDWGKEEKMMWKKMFFFYFYSCLIRLFLKKIVVLEKFR